MSCFLIFLIINKGNVKRIRKVRADQEAQESRPIWPINDFQLIFRVSIYIFSILVHWSVIYGLPTKSIIVMAGFPPSKFPQLRIECAWGWVRQKIILTSQGSGGNVKVAGNDISLGECHVELPPFINLMIFSAVSSAEFVQEWYIKIKRNRDGWPNVKSC